MKGQMFVIGAIIVIVGVWFWLGQPASNAPTTDNSMVSGADTTSAIDQDLNNISVDTPDFNSIDTDLNSL